MLRNCERRHGTYSPQLALAATATECEFDHENWRLVGVHTWRCTILIDRLEGGIPLNDHPGKSPIDHVRPDPHVVSAMRGSEVILLDLRKDEYFSANRIGGQIWQAICDGTSLDALVEEVARNTTTPADQVERDVSAFIQMLADAALVRID